MEIRKVLERNDGVKYLIIPRASLLKKWDYVAMIKIDEKEVMKNAKGRKG